MKIPTALAAACLLTLLAACAPPAEPVVNGVSPEDGLATMAAANPTTDPALENAAAEPAATATTEPQEPAPPMPDFSELQIPADYGVLEQTDGVWTLSDVPVALVYQPDGAGGWDLWLTQADNQSYPILMRSAGEDWRVGLDAWHAKITLMNLADGDVHVTISAKGEDPLELDLTPYEIYNISWLPPETYDVEFTFTGEESFDLACHITFSNSSDVSFAALPVGVAVADANIALQSGSDLDIRTSPLCGN